MIKHKRLRIAVMIAVALAASGCSLFKRGKAASTPVLGKRIAVLTTEGDVQVDLATAAMPMSLPQATVNDAWTQSGGNASKSMGQLALGNSLAQSWVVQAGRGSSLTARLAAPPIAANGRVYTIDTLGAVRAFDASSGRMLWASQTPFEERSNTPSLYGGGIAYDNGTIYATNGLGWVAALNESNGGISWKVRPGGPLRGAPTLGNNAIYVMSQDNQLYSLSEQDGSTNWSQAAALEIAGLFGSASPAVGQGTVVAGFSSGELNAYRYENGRAVWGDMLARTGISTSVSTLSDIDAEPVIDEGKVYAVGQGGRMAALDITTGQRLWELNIAGVASPAVAGEWVFVVTDQAKLLCIARSSGKVRWISELPRWRNEKKEEKPIMWVGPVVAGDRLILASSDGRLANISPSDGHLLSVVDLNTPMFLSPAVANNTLYTLDDKGHLTAWR